MMKTVEVRLNEQLAQKEARISELEEQLSGIEYKEDWKWRHLKTLTEAENLGLPLPRLEIRYYQLYKNTFVADYGLVHKHFLMHIEFIPFSSTRMNGSRIDAECLALPFRDGAHIKNDMRELKLPGYVVNGAKFKEVLSED